jgi:hypothetical protein
MKPNGFFLEEINIPSIKKSNERRLTVKKPEGKVLLNPENTLSLYPLTRRVYRVAIQFPVEKQSVGYEIKVRSKTLSTQSINIEYQKNYFFIEGKTPQRSVDQLAIACTEILYPIQIIVNYNTGGKQISNHKQIKQKFEKQLPELQRNYKGGIFFQYIQEIQQNLANPDLFIQRLIYNDLFFALHTHTLYKTYPQSREVESKIKLRVPKVSYPLTFTGRLKIDENYNNMMGFYIHFHGIATSLSGQVYKLYVEYNMDYIDYTIKDIVAEIKTGTEEDNVKLCKMTCYQLREEEPSPQEKELQHAQYLQKQKEKEIEEEENYQKYLRKKRSWFDRLFSI